MLFVYYTYTQQTLKVVEAMADVLGSRGCEVHRARIEFADSRYGKRFATFPMRHPMFEVVTMVLPELRRATTEIRIPDAVTDGEYDLVCIGSPTWWLSTSVAIRSFLVSDEAGRLLAGTRFTAFVACRRYWRHNLATVQKLGTKRGGRRLPIMSATPASWTGWAPAPGRTHR